MAAGSPRAQVLYVPLSVVVSPDFEPRYFFLFKKLELPHTGKYFPLTQSPFLNCKLL